MIKRQGHDGFLQICLVGLNFDTADDMRGEQVEHLDHYINCRFCHFGNKKYFSTVIFGDFNNRLVCPEWLSPHVDFEDAGEENGSGGPTLTEEGAKQMCSIFADPKKRLDLMRSTDSWVFNGRDATGTDIDVPVACSELRRLFTLHFDICTDAPLPTYKRTPIGEVLGQKLGFPFEVKELITREQLMHGLKNLLKLRTLLRWKGTEKQSTFNLEHHIHHKYFPGRECRVTLPKMTEESTERHTSHEGGDEDIDEDDCEDLKYAAVIDCGWPDKIGVLKDGVLVKADVLFWGTCESLSGALEHRPSVEAFR